jgi:DNA-directed RNA polymerase specialized sigma24 family protein
MRAEQPAVLHDLLQAFLAGDPVARNTLPRVAERYLTVIVRRLDPLLPEDLRGEVVNQALLNLLRQGPRSYRPASGSAGTFLGLLVRNALRQVRAMYAPPGQRKRVRPPKGGSAKQKSGPVMITAQPPEELVGPQEPAAPDDIAALEIRLDVDALLQRAPADVAEGLRRVYLEDQPMQDAAEALGVSRFVLSRKLSGYAESVRAAA